MDFKIVFLGDKGCGKTSAIEALTNEIPTFCRESSFRGTTKSIVINDTKIDVIVWEQETYDKYDMVRPLFYSETQVAVICFDLNNEKSLRNVETEWYQQVKQYCPKAPIVILGLKSDIKAESTETVIDQSQIDRIKEITHAVLYRECSAHQFVGASNLLEQIVKLCLDLKGQKSWDCPML